MFRLLLFSFILPFLTEPAWSELPTEAQPTEVERLIKQLGSDSFSERETASKALEAIGEPALEALKKAATESDGFDEP
jgi:hypothetical protein